MHREFYLASVLSAVWISMCFLLFGGLYTSIPKIVGWGAFHQFESSLGHIQVFGGGSIPWVSLIVFGVTMFVASAPINYYWLRRLHDDRS